MGGSKGWRLALASAGAIAATALFAPAAAVAHPCATANANVASSFLSLNNATWAGVRPVEVGHECVSDSGALTATMERQAEAGEPVQDAVNPSTFDWSPNMTPIGYSANIIPFLPAPYNSDLAFSGNLAIQGVNNGFRIVNIENPANPTQLVNYTGCTVSQGDVVVYKNILIRSWDSAVSAGAAATASCGGTLAGQGFEGIHIFDITDPTNPVMFDVDKNPDNGKQGLRYSQNGMPPGALTGCGSHTATAVPDEARGYLYIYNGGSSGTCQGIDIFKIKMSDPADATVVRRAAAGRQCHDNTVFLNGANSYASCAGGNGISMFKFDTTIDPTAAGGIENPTLLWNKPMGVSTGHSAAFSYDGKTVVFGHEPGGGVAAQCQTTSSVTNRSLFFLNVETGDQISTLVHPRFQNNTENCTWHNFNTVPTKGGNYLVSGNYQAGINVIDFTAPAAPKVIAYADPKPLAHTTTYGGDGYPDGGDWSTYWYNGKIYESDIYRGMMVWDLDNSFTDRANTVSYSNPQTQIGAIVADNVAPTVSIAAPIENAGFLQGSAQPASFSCADEGLGVESCTGTVANGANIDTATIGNKTFTVTAVDNAGNTTTKTVNFMVNSTAVPGGGGATVPATLALAMGPQAAFGAFTPGIAKEYTATTMANVVSTAGDGALSVSDASSTNTGKLVNGAFTLAQPMMASAASAGGTSPAGGAVGGSAAPTSVLTYTGPVSNDAVTFTFKQTIGANEALRTGTYSKTLTFTLSTTTP